MAAVAQNGSGALVTLRDGLEVRLKDVQGVSDRNDGVLVLPPPKAMTTPTFRGGVSVASSFSGDGRCRKLPGPGPPPQAQTPMESSIGTLDLVPIYPCSSESFLVSARAQYAVRLGVLDRGSVCKMAAEARDVLLSYLPGIQHMAKSPNAVAVALA